MKKLKLFVVPLMSIAFLVSCNQQSNPKSDWVINFNSNGGNFVPSQLVKNGEKAIQPDDPDKEDFYFVGWSLDGVEYDFSSPVTNDITLEAKWVKCDFDDDCDYLTFNALKDSEVAYTTYGSPSINMQYSTDMNNWEDWSNKTYISVKKDEKIYVRNTSEHLSVQNVGHVRFSLSGMLAASGSISSLTNNGQGKIGEAEYSRLFEGSNLVRAPKLPALELEQYCYSNMFRGCMKLKEMPDLPALSLAYGCYAHMFDSCLNLKKVHPLPAINLSENCYDSMFCNCHKLVEAPTISATSLSEYCYSGMFENCYCLKKAPALPATALKDSCYQSMFFNCFSLEEAPELPATSLAESCYYDMFWNCYNLETLKVGFGTPGTEEWPEVEECTSEWLSQAGKNVNKPTFIWKGRTSDFTEGWRSTSTIPENWVVENPS